MKATAEKTDKNSVKLTIEIDAEEFDKSMQKAYLKNRKHINIPGFRKGKAPRKIIEQFYGEAIFYEDAANDIIISTYSDAVKETGIEPVSQPEFDIIQIGNGQNFIYSADVVVKPEVELGEYKGIEIEKVEYNVTDEDVENEISKIREENARLINIEDRPVQEGDQVILDYKGMIDGEEFEGGSAENAVLEVGSNMFIPGFEEQLIGMNIGEEKEIKVTFPEDYHVEEIKGKEAVFKVKIKEIKEKELPELDDEFAKDVSEFDTFEEFKADVKRKLEEAVQDNMRAEMENNLLQKVVENANVDIPEPMIESEIDRQINELDFTLRYQGLSLEQYLSFVDMSMDDIRAQHRDQAYGTVKMRLVLEKIGEVEGIEVNDDDLEKEFEKLSEQYGRDVEDIKKDFESNVDYIKANLKVQKTVDFLMDNAIIVEEDKDNKDNKDNKDEDNTDKDNNK